MTSVKKVLEVKRRKEKEEAIIEQQFAAAGGSAGSGAGAGAGAGATPAAKPGAASMLSGADDVDLLF